MSDTQNPNGGVVVAEEEVIVEAPVATPADAVTAEVAETCAVEVAPEEVAAEATPEVTA